MMKNVKKNKEKRQKEQMMTRKMENIKKKEKRNGEDND